MSVSVIIPSAGTGSRMGGKKQFMQLLGKPLISYTLKPFEDSEYVSEIILVVGKDDVEEAKKIVERNNFSKVKTIVAGGKERQDSVFEGLQKISPESKYVLIHDGARPFITKQVIALAVDEVEKHGAVVVAVPTKDTMKAVSDDSFIKETLRRGSVVHIQTPQIFQYNIIKKAHEQAREDGYLATDDSALVERLGQKVRIIPGSYENIKITTPEDLTFAEAIIGKRSKNK